MKNITAEIWIAFIGAFSALIGAIISTISIIITNKNTKSIKLLENSIYVKTEISKKRLESYNKIINYINSWYDIEIEYDHDYINCKARKYLKTVIFQSRLKNEDALINEYKKITQLSLEYFYLDSKSYKILKSLENYLSSVINCKKTRNVGNLNMFYYITYCDVGEYIFRLSKQVNKFINKIDTLKYKQSNSIKNQYIEKYYYRTNFYSIYDNMMLTKDFDNELKESIMQDIERINKEIISYKAELEDAKNKKIRFLINKKIKASNRCKSRLLNFKFLSKYCKIKINDTYKMWMICKNCKNQNCILSDKNGDIT